MHSRLISYVAVAAMSFSFNLDCIWVTSYDVLW